MTDFASDGAGDIVAIARRHALRTPDRPAYVFLGDGETEQERCTFARLDVRARAIAAALQEQGLAGQRAIIAYPSGLEYVQAFLGCLYAGVVAVPADSPSAAAGRKRLAAIRSDCAPAAVLTDAVQEAEELAGLPRIDTARVPDEAADGWTDPRVRPEDLAFLQYTSGSTRTPRGVMVGHSNIVANERLIAAACEHDEQSTFVGWQPLFHDMGLIANIMQPLFLGSLSVLMPPMAFLQRPLRWLEAVSRYRAHTSGGPNFAYDLCVDRLEAAGSGEAGDGGPVEMDLDLSGWRVAFNSAEPIRQDSLRRFTEAFAPYGFADSAHFPCFGLAEATLLVTAPPKYAAARIRRADPVALRAGRLAEAAPDAEAVPLVGSGYPGLETEVRIVDPSTVTENGPGAVGEIWVAGGGVAQGLWGDPEASAATLGASLPGAPGRRFLRTGDLGALLDGELYVTGRLKDVIIVQGRNHYPQDLELDAENAFPALRPGCTAAFSVEADGGERVVLCAELRAYKSDFEVSEAARLIAEELRRRHGVELERLVVLRRGGVPKTTSGKLRRQQCRLSYLAGELPVYRQAAPERPTAVALPVAGRLRSLPGPEAADVLGMALMGLVAARVGTGPADTPPALERTVPELGADSLAAQELDHALRLAYGVELGVGELLGGSTVGELAARVVRELAAGAVSAVSAVSAASAVSADGDAREPEAPPTDPDAWLPLTFRQQALWFEQELAPDSAAYHLARALSVTGVPADRLAQALSRLIVAHPGLRTEFAVQDSIPSCHVVSEVGEVRVIDAANRTEEEFAGLLLRESERPFDFAAGPPVRFTVYRRSPEVAVLLLVTHHLVADFWSLVVLMRELRALMGDDTAVELAVVALPADAGHRAVLAAERSQMESRRAERGADYWRAELSGVPALLDLPAEGPAPAERRFDGAALTFTVPPELTTRLKTLAAERSCTPFTLLLAAYEVLLHRWCDQDDLVVGTLLSGRADPALTETVGYLVDVVPLRSRFDARQPFDRFLRTAGRSVAGALEHGWYPFGRIVADLAPERAPGRAPLVQSLFTMHAEYGERDDLLRALALGVPGERAASRSARSGEPAWRTVPITRRWSQFDLGLALAEVGGELVGVWEYRTDLFSEAVIAELGAAYVRLLEAAVERPGTPIADLPLKRALPDRLSGPAPGPVRPEVGLHHLVAEAARRRPDAMAIAAPGPDGRAGQMSYRTLHRSAAALAARLRTRGVRSDEPVAVVAERGLDMIVAYLGVLYAGAAVLPIDPADPDPRVAAVIADSGARLAVTPTSLLERAQQWPAEAVAADMADTADRAPAPVHTADGEPQAPAPVHGHQAAYVLYTSGSSGTPKGVVVPHAAIVNRILWMQDEYRLTPGERVLHKTPMTFDVSMWEIFWPLAAGGCLVLAEPGRHRDPRYLLDTMARERVSTTHFVPTMLGPVVAEAAHSGGPGGVLRRVVCSGEALPATLASAASAVLGTEVHNLYGPTEAAVDVTAWRCEPGDPGPVPIGRAIAHVECRVLDRNRHAVPVRTRGELFLGGVCLARGYLNQPALTARSFVPVPDAAPGVRFYRTGDLVRSRTDEALEFLGRRDDQVKIGGARVEPDESAAAIRRQPGVADVAVIAVDRGRGMVLAAYVVPAADTVIDPVRLRAELRAQLPAHLVPAEVTLLAALPLTASGKLDRRALPAAPAQASEATDITMTDGDPVRNLLLDLWRTHLDRESIDPDEDFFALGGDSILAVRLVGAARERGLALTVTDLLRDRTVSALADLLGARAPAPDGNGRTAPFHLCPEAAGKPGLQDAYPISAGQRALLFQQDVNAGYEVYLTSLEVHTPLERTLLEAAIRDLCRRHPYLRSSFDLTGYAEPMQLVHAERPAPFEVVDLTALTADAQSAAMRSWFAAERRRRFDTATGSLVRFAAHDLGARFRLSVSSFALDGWCDATVLTELLTDYAARCAGTDAGLVAPRADYRDFVAAERAATAGTEHRRFWRLELAGRAPTLVATSQDIEDDPVQRRLAVPLSGALAERLRERAVEWGTGLKHVLLAAHLQVVGELAGRAEVVTGLQFNGRPEAADGDRVIGMFNNILPLCVSLPGAGWADLARAAARAELRLAPHRRFPLLELQRRFGGADLFDTLFVFTHFHAYRRLAGLEVSRLEAPDQTYVPLTAHAHVDAWSGELGLALDFDPRVFGARRVAEIGQRYARALAGIADAEPAAESDTAAAAELAAQTDAPAAAPDRPEDDLGRLLDRLAGLTDQEAAALLAGRRPRAVATTRGTRGSGTDGTR